MQLRCNVLPLKKGVLRGMRVVGVLVVGVLVVHYVQECVGTCCIEHQ